MNGVSSIRESLRSCKDFLCKTCSAVAEADDPFLTFITIDEDEYETASEFCYLSDVVGHAGGVIDLLLPKLDLLGRLSINFYLYS